MPQLYCICGAWKLVDNIWVFVLDFDRGASLTIIDDHIRFSDLVAAVLEDYGVDVGKRYNVKLSYRLQGHPPFYIRSDRQVEAFLQKLAEVGGSLQLCVTLEEVQTRSVPLMELRNPSTSNEVLFDESITCPSSSSLQRQTRSTPILVENSAEECHVGREIQTRSVPLMELRNPSTSNEVLFDESITCHSSSSLQRQTRSTPILVENSAEECHVGPEIPTVSINNNVSSSEMSFSTRSQVCAPSVSSNGQHCGKLFKDKQEMTNFMRRFAMANSLEFRTIKSDNLRYVIHCIDTSCSWRLRATRVEASESFCIRTYVGDHTCDSSLRNVNHRQATAKTLGKMVSNHYEGGKLPLRPKQLIEKFRKDHGVCVSYDKAYRAQEYAIVVARGTANDGYEVLPSWLHMVSVKNPGSACYIEVDDAKKFKYSFLAFGPSIRGFQLMRKVICLDGCFLKAKFRGTLLGATAQDGNFQLYPLAFGVVDSENDASWEWFLQCLMTIIPDEADLVFVSDRAPSIASALSKIYPLAHHCFCIFHLEKNLETRFRKSSALIPVVKSVAGAYTRFEFDNSFRELSLADPDLGQYLWEVGIHRWSRAYSPSNRYNIMTSNIAESLNSMLREGREYPIVCLLETIRSTLTRWFNERREFGSRHRHSVTLNVGNQMKAAYDDNSRWLEVHPVNQQVFEVKGDKLTHVVNLETRQCTCGKFDFTKIPCAHAIASAKHIHVNENNFVDSCYSNERWTLAYSESIYPVGDMAQWDIPAHVAGFVCKPPSTRVPSGRRKKKRIPCVWEHGKSQTKSNSHKCSRCGQSGHNKTRCVVPI